jgi:glycerol-3-phosphate dehydrogenase
MVVNAAGPWCRDVASTFDQDHAPLFKKRLLLWNVLFNREALSDHLLGLTLDKGRGHTYFCQPWKNRLLLGTPEIIVEKNDTKVPAQEMDKFINDINKIVPGLKLKKEEIQRVYSGILPATDGGKLANREVIFDHETKGGPKGLFSISGVKFTTSRLVAEKTINKIFPQGDRIPYHQLLDSMKRGKISFDYAWEPKTLEDLDRLKSIIENESVLHLSDLVLRRTSIGDHPQRAFNILPKLKTLFKWGNHRWDQEKDLLKKELEF